MKIKSFLLTLLLACLPGPHASAQSLEAGFANPPAQTKPWCYWYWISDNLSKEGITRDLEAMARVGIGEALIGNIFLNDVPAGKIKVFTPEWWDLIGHALREGGRTGVDIGMFNCPGWSQSGGPWIKPSQTMRYLASSETRVTGPVKFNAKLPAPGADFQDVAVLAFPAPAKDADLLAKHAPKISSSPAAPQLAKLMDDNLATACAFPGGAGRGNTPFQIDMEVAAAFTARSLQLTPSAQPFAADCELQAADAAGVYQTVRRFRADRSNMAPGVGFMPRGPVTVAFPAVTATKFRLLFTHASGNPELAEIGLSGAARLESYVEKQLGKMHPTPLPMWDTYLWPTQAEPDDAGTAVALDGERDLTKHLAPDGTLTWEVPAGEWIIQRTGMLPTNMHNSPASPEGTGLEVDKMNRGLAKLHFDSFIGEVLKRVPAADRKAFKQVVADSYEMGSQNWTDGLDVQFRDCYGYDPKPWLPVLSGRLVGGADRSERFLWDLRRLVAERIATDYVGGLRDASKAQGLGLWLENYGHWGFPSEFLKYGGASDRIGGEYWVTGDLGSIECRAATSCANTYGKPFVSAESFTGGPAFQNAPAALKARGDWAFCEGINHFVLHVYIQQPWEDKVPGVNAWFGTEFNRHNTWFEQGKAWIDYLRRCCWLLQQGNRVADVAYFIGEDAPKMTGVRNPELPPGRDFDYINSEVIETSLTVKNGLLALPHGTTYQVLVLPELATMRPEVLGKIVALVKAGATVYGTPPSRSPSMERYPQCDEEIRQMATELWGDADTRKPGERAVGFGRLVWGKPLAEVLKARGSPPDFQSSDPLRFTHRRSGKTNLFFIANPQAESLTTTVALRAYHMAPELWWPDSGKIEKPAVYEVGANDVIQMPLTLGPHGSVFVVFRETAAPPAERIVSVRRNGGEVLGTTVTPTGPSRDESPNQFSFALWVKPAAETALMPEAKAGIIGLQAKRNDVFAAPHGDGFGGAGHAGCGLAVGTNGVAVFEHGASYFVPILVHPTKLADWTHVAVVYQNGKPRLFLNGLPVRAGLQSDHTVHSGAGAGALAQFRGEAGPISRFACALSDQEVGDLVGSMPRPTSSETGPPLQLTRINGKLTALAAAAGAYEWTFADGSLGKLTVGELPAPQVLTGPWEVRFAAGRGAPERATFDSLIDWTARPEDGIKHFSGTAVYQQTFNLPAAAMPTPQSRLLLDLGAVRDLATVRVNGHNLGTLWLAPFQLDLTDVVKPGANTLEVAVTNVWNNRLAGDAALPVAKRVTYLQAPAVKADAPLLPAGLLGPVQLRHTVTSSGR